MLHPRWGGGGAGLSRVVLYVFLFVFIVVGLPTAIVLERWWSMPRKSPEFTIRLLREDLGEIQEMDLEDYLVGVVAAEMPANFDLEALKGWAAVDKEKCIGCGKCEKPAHCTAVKIENKKSVITPEECLGCGICEALCPTKAITMYVAE